MRRNNPRGLADRVTEAAEAALAAQDYVSRVDVLVRIGWLDPGTVQRWQQGQIDFIEQDRLAEKAGRAPELVVVEPLNDKWTCHRCGGTGDLLIMENPVRRACAASVSTISSSCLPAMRSSRAGPRRKASGMRSLRFSKSRRRYERQGLLVEPQALTEAERELAAQER
jgi:hypothetical protein